MRPDPNSDDYVDLVIPKEVLPQKYYSDYCSGHGQLYPPGVVAKLHEAALRTNPKFHVDDAFLGTAITRLDSVTIKDGFPLFNQCLTQSCNGTTVVEKFDKIWLYGDVIDNMNFTEVWKEITKPKVEKILDISKLSDFERTKFFVELLGVHLITMTSVILVYVMLKFSMCNRTRLRTISVSTIKKL